MSEFRIVFNRLPDAILKRVLQVGNIQSGDPEWCLLRSGNTRRTYRFTPAEGGPAWVVKWGFRSYTSIKKIGNALRGRDAATVEWQLTRQAADRGLDVLDFELVATPNILRGSFQTLLITRYLDDTCNFLEYLARHWNDEARIEDVLIKLADEIAAIHKAGLLHQDLSLDNILVKGSEAQRVIVIDWFKSFETPKGKTDRYFVEFLAPLSDMIYAGLPERCLRLFLQHYSRSMPWCESEIDALIEAAWKTRRSVCQRAYRNCTRRSRRLIQYHSHGYRVYQFKEADRSQIESDLAAPVPSEKILIGKSESPQDSIRLKRWRMANLLHMTGIKGHCVAAYALQKNWLNSKNNVQEILFYAPPTEAVPVSQIVSGKISFRLRRRVIHQAGRFMRRLHNLGIDIKSIDLNDFHYCEEANGQLLFFSKMLDCFEISKNKQNHTKPTTPEQMLWLNDKTFTTFGIKDLVIFLKGYGLGVTDRALLKKIIDSQPSLHN